MIDRERRITTAHGSTFQWVLHANFQEQEPRRVKWSDLREWLESDQQLYWITGKAGSGKSTLMKFLCSSTANVPPLVVVEEEEGCGAPMESYRCHPYLKKWASPSLLVVASFYFWNSGKEMQMTQEGLLRTLLYQITSQCPEIIAEIDPGYWESLCLFGLQVTNWRVQVLHKMLFQAVDALSKTSKICLFVDGLDEFANNHEDLIFMVKELIQSSRQIKVCVASRPWNVFQDALGQGPSLRLEDLTFNDIKVFVESKFHADPEFEKLKWRYPSFTNQLIENIVAKASGVFLWVDLVVTSLLAGMTRGDRIQDFQRRLDELPPDLENLYEKILYSLDQRYLEHAAQYFALVEAARDPLTILQFAFADEESVESALKMACGPLDEYGIRLRIEAMSRRLNSRCKGFLEIDKGMQVIQGIHERHPSEVTVQYLHRTLRDFIKSPKAQKYLRSSMDPRSDPFIQLCITYLMSIKTRLAHLLLERGIIRCLIAAANVTQLNEAAMILLVDELKNEAKRPASWQQLYKMFGRESLYVQHRSPRLEQFISSSPSDKDFLRLAIIFEVVPYVRARATQAGFIQNAVPENPRRDPSLLLIALYCVEPNPTMVECLLDLGVEPNLKLSKSDSKTLWMFALTQVSTLYKIQNDLTPERYLEVEDKWKQTLKLMFLRGGHLAKVPDPLLTPISRRLLKEIKDEVGPIDQPNMGLTAWLGSIKLK